MPNGRLFCMSLARGGRRGRCKLGGREVHGGMDMVNLSASYR